MDTHRPLLLLLLSQLGCHDGPAKDDERSEDGCVQLPEGEEECPPPELEALGYLTPRTCGATVLSVDGPGTKGTCGWLEAPDTASSSCVYPITVRIPDSECDYGRPLSMDDGPRSASPVEREGWTAALEVAPLSAAQRARWAQIGLAEHASVASFGRFALELMALGAPAELIAAAHRAALDEVRHAELAFGLASAGGPPLGPGPLALGDLQIRADLVELAVATAREGCVAETLSALRMAAARDRASGAERAALVEIAADEARHAALAWRTVRWALSAGGEAVRSAVQAVFEAPAVMSGDEERGWREVILPAARALLGAPWRTEGQPRPPGPPRMPAPA